MSNLPSSPDQARQKTPENSEANFIYGIDVMSLKLRLPAKKRVTMSCYIGKDDKGQIVQITNEGISDDIKIIEGNSKRLLKPDTVIYLTEEDLARCGFQPKEAKKRLIAIPVTEEPDVETTGVRIREASGAISRDITQVIGGEEKKAG